MNNNTNACEAQASMPPMRDVEATLASSQFRQVKINKVANGFIVEVGCKTLVADVWEKVADGLSMYFKDPVAAEKKYCAAQELR